MKFFIFIFSSLPFNFACNNAQVKMENKITTDSIERPANMSKEASLLNFGSEEEPIMVWADFIGMYQNKGGKYPHINGVKYYYVKADKYDTLYYENMELRKANKQFNFKDYSIKNFPGDATIKLYNAKDSAIFFSVIESAEFMREHRGITFKRMPTASVYNGNYISDVEIEFNLKETGNGIFDLTLNDGSVIKYKISSDCKVKNLQGSFLNRQDGRVYFVDLKCYLELINKSDVEKFQGLR